MTQKQCNSSKDNDDEAVGTAKEKWARWGAIGIFAVNTIGLGLFHYHGNDPTAKQPDDLPIQSPLDKMFFGVLVLMAFELLDFLTKHSGSKYQNRTSGFIHRVCTPMADQLNTLFPLRLYVNVARCVHEQNGYSHQRSLCEANIWTIYVGWMYCASDSARPIRRPLPTCSSGTAGITCPGMYIP
jgi:hypothetical protein